MWANVVEQRNDRVAKRRWSQFSLRTLMITVLLCGSAATLWWQWEPWILERTITGHTGYITCLAYSPDGQSIGSAGDDGVCIWDAASGAAKLRLSDIYADSVTFTPDSGQIAATSSIDGWLRVWDCRTGKMQEESAQLSQDAAYTAFSLNDNWRVFTGVSEVGPQEGIGRIRNGKTQAVEAILTGHSALIQSAQFSPDGQHIVTASRDSTARIWNSKSGIQEMVFHCMSEVSAAAFSPDGKRVVTGTIGTDDTAQVWDAITGAQQVILVGHGKSTFSARFSSDGTRILTGGSDNSSRVWSDSGEFLAILSAHSKWIRSGVFSPDATHIATAGDDGTICLWFRRHPDCRFNALLLPVFWLTALLSIALALSIWRDRRSR